MEFIKRRIKSTQYVVDDLDGVWVYEISRFDDLVEVWFYNDQYGEKILLFGTDDIKHRDKYYLDMVNIEADAWFYYKTVIEEGGEVL